MIDFPANTYVGKPVPKNAFYKHLEVNANMKQHFVDDVVDIKWLYKLAPSTLNVDDGKNVHEIVVFLAKLKQQKCPNDVFLFIDKQMPRHVVFILEHDGKYKLLLNYKEWLDKTAGTFKIVKTFDTEWLNKDALRLPISGLSMDAIYESMAGQISGYGTNRSVDTKRIVELKGQACKLKKEIELLQKKVRNEKQLNRQMEINKELKSKKGEYNKIVSQIESLRI